MNRNSSKRSLAGCAIVSVMGFALAAMASGKLAEISLQGDPITASTSDSVTPAAETSPGGGPEAVAFDGTYIWVARQFSNAVTRVNARDGSKAGSFQVGERPTALLFDQKNKSLWVANLLGNNVMKLALDGSVLLTARTGRGPGGLAFDGEYIWVANRNDGTVTKVRALDGAVAGTFPVGRRPMGLAFDGAHIWVANQKDNSLMKLRLSDGLVLAAYKVGDGPFGLLFDGDNLWVTNYFGKTVSKIRSADGTTLATYSAGDGAAGIATDGKRIWVALNGQDSVIALDPSTGSTLTTLATGRSPFGVVCDGANIWVANSGSDSLSTSAAISTK